MERVVERERSSARAAHYEVAGSKKGKTQKKEKCFSEALAS